MSVANPVSPQHDYLSFLPHPPLPSSSRTPPASSSPLSSPSFSRSNTTSPRSAFMTSRSAPTSPVHRPQLHKGLAPLSSISSINLDTTPQESQHHDPYLAASQLPSQHAGPSHSTPSNTSSNPVQTEPTSTFFPSSNLARPPNLIRSTVRSRSIYQPGSSSDDTETEHDSDSTFVPGRIKQKKSLSQPDLTALRSWAGGVAQGQLEERRARDARNPKCPPVARKSVPPRPIPPTTQPAPLGRSNLSKSQPSLVALRGTNSPRQTSTIPPLTPVLSRTHLSFLSEISSSPKIGIGGITGSEGSDDDYESTDSPSSGSLTFSPKRTRGLRHRVLADRSKTEGLGLSLEASDVVQDKQKEEPVPVLLERRLRQSSLRSLRLLAVVPSLWGICVLLEALITGGLWHDVWPWGVDLSRDAFERLVHGDVAVERTVRPVSRGDMALSIAWAICTAHFCFRLTTGLTHRWRSYYSLPSTITRLVSLQCLCWPATYITLWFLGADRPLLAWIVIGVTTGWSRTVQMWVTSNVTPEDRGNVTPGSTTRRAKVRSPRIQPVPPEGLSPWEAFVFGRRWDWDAVAREVGWKVGGLLLVTSAWLFWGIETGRLVRA